MGLLNVARVVRNRNFAKRLNITRRATTVNEQGLNVTDEQTLTPIGVFLAGTTPPFVQDSDYQHAQSTATVYVYGLRLLDPAAGYQPDIVNDKGNRYIVRRVYDWTDWGPGWCAAECEMLNLETATDA